jgi:hypothetical protein
MIHKQHLSELELYKGILEDYKDMTPEEDRAYRYEMWRRYCVAKKEVTRLERAVEILSLTIDERINHEPVFEAQED